MPLIFSISLTAQEASQIDQLRIQVWADLDPFPGSFDSPSSVGQSESFQPQADDKLAIFEYAINRTKEITPFLMSGMLNGWMFEYTPFDKTRRVEEYWSFEEILPFNPSINHITYHAPKAMDDRLVCWAYCNKTPMQKQEYEHWSSIVHPHIKGIGKGPVEAGFEGIKEACSQAAKNAVREYWRTKIKNKPKEIDGKLLLIRNPRIYIKDGNYVVDLDFFLETDKIIEYTLY